MNQQRHLGGYLRAISNALAQELQQQTEQLGLTSSQGMFLHFLWRQQEANGQDIYAKDLEEFFDIKHSTVSGILQRMESAGFLTLQASLADRRCKTICLTQKALDAHAQIEQHLQHSEQQLMDGMDEDERVQFRHLLQLAAKNLGVCRTRPTIDEKEGTP